MCELGSAVRSRQPADVHDPAAERNTDMARSDTPADTLIDISALADRFGVSVRYVRRLVAERRIPYIKLGTCSASILPRSTPGSTEPACARAGSDRA
jgi:hypothetical protein